MTDTTRLKLPLLSASQAQKHVTVNEALIMLDLLTGVINVTNRVLTTPAGGEPDGTVYILGGAGTGAWAGFSADDLALAIDGGWRRVLPSTGMIATIAAEAGIEVRYGGASWDETLAAAVLTNYAANLYQDSGRMAGNNAYAPTIGSYAFPGYLSLFNATTQASLAKFLYNNTDYGGTAGTLDSNVKDLIDQIRDSAHRQYGPEFWVSKVTMGSGTSTAQSAGGKTGYLSLYTSQRIILPAMTFHTYIRALTKELVIPPITGQTYFKNGVAQTGNFLIAPSDNWVSVTVQQNINPRTSLGYNPSIFYVYAQAPGDQYLIACPALMGGLTAVDDNVGVIASTTSWPA